MEGILCNNIKLLRYINTPVHSVTYLIVDERHKGCICIDPGSKEESAILAYILTNGLSLDYIILTHEHFDHCWGVNYLKERFIEAKIVSTRLCADWVMKPWNYFNQMYYNSDECYQIPKVDLLVEEIDFKLKWNDVGVKFIHTLGHTNKGMCIEIGECLFTGDTLLLNTKPYLKKKYGASKEELKKSVDDIFQAYSPKIRIYPGHGEPFLLEEAKEYYVNYFKV